MFTAEDYLLENPSFYNNPQPVNKVQEKVFKQAIRHTRRLEFDQAIKTARPNELPSVSAYRNDNRRWLTVAEVDLFHSKVSRIIKDSVLGSSNVSDSLDKFLSTNPFECLGESISISDFVFRVIFQRATEDPNSLWVAFPYNSENPTISPNLNPIDGGLPSNKKISIKSKIIPYSDVYDVTEDVFIFKGGVMRVITGRDTYQDKDFFWIADKDWWYQLVPKYNSAKKTFYYELEKWFEHATGTEDKKELPLNFLPGSTKTFEKDEKVKYNESFMHPFFEYADEAMNRFSDNQAVAIQHAFPKMILKEIPCQQEGCEDGRIIQRDETGKKIGVVTCSNCKGEGTIKSIDPYSVLIAPGSSSFEKDNNQPVLQYVSPDSSILAHSYETPFDLLKKGARKIGLDVLMAMAESGTAKGMRLEDLQDILAKVGYGLLKCQERFMWHSECLLNPSKRTRKRPNVQIPVSYQFKDLQTLVEEAKEALPVDKYESTMAVIRKKYAGDSIKSRIQELSLNYCPALLLDNAGRKDCLLLSSNPERLCIKIERSIWAFTRLSERADFLEAKESDLFKLADELIEDFMPEKEETVQLFDPENPDVSANE